VSHSQTFRIISHPLQDVESPITRSRHRGRLGYQAERGACGGMTHGVHVPDAAGLSRPPTPEGHVMRVDVPLKADAVAVHPASLKPPPHGGPVAGRHIGRCSDRSSAMDTRPPIRYLKADGVDSGGGLGSRLTGRGSVHAGGRFDDCRTLRVVFSSRSLDPRSHSLSARAKLFLHLSVRRILHMAEIVERNVKLILVEYLPDSLLRSVHASG
jgi:hypothetical protein